MNEDRKIILAVDDTPMQLHALIKILQPLYAVKIAKSGEAGIEFAMNNKIDLIMLDVIMPGMSGLEVLEILKQEEKTKNIPVVLATGNTSEDDKKNGMDKGASDYIEKPFDHNIVHDCISRLLSVNI